MNMTSEASTRVRYRTMGWLTLAAALAYLCRNAVGGAESTIRTELELSLEQSGWFMGAFFWTYALFQVPSGGFAARHGTRRALTFFGVGWSVAAMGIGVAPGFGLLIAAQLLMGATQAGMFPAACNSVGHWMPLAQRSIACGVLAAGMQIGAIIAGGLTGMLMAPLGWRWAFTIFALPGIVWAIGFHARFRDRPEQTKAVNATELRLIGEGRLKDGPAPGEKKGVPWHEILPIRRYGCFAVSRSVEPPVTCSLPVGFRHFSRRHGGYRSGIRATCRASCWLGRLPEACSAAWSRTGFGAGLATCVSAGEGWGRWSLVPVGFSSSPHGSWKVPGLQSPC